MGRPRKPPHPPPHSRTAGGAAIKNRTQLSSEQDRRGGKTITFCELPTRGHHTLRTEGCRVRGGLGTGGRPRVSETESSRVASSFHGILPRTAVGGPLGQSPQRQQWGQCGRKMSEHCCRMNSTTWFWNTMVMDMLVSSVSGRSSVGPNTMATLCTDMRFCSPRSTTLQRVGVRWTQGPAAGGGWGIPPGPTSPFPPRPPPLTGTGAGRAAAGCRGWGRAASAPGPAHSGCAGPGPAALGTARVRGRKGVG